MISERQRTQDFSENEDKNHADEQPGLLGGTTDTSITNDTDGETGGETGETDGQTSAELDEVGEEGALLLQAVGDQDGDDQTVDTNDTSHNDGDNVCARVSCPSSFIQRRNRGIHTTGEMAAVAAAAEGAILLTIRSGLRTPMAEIPTPALAVP